MERHLDSDMYNMRQAMCMTLGTCAFVGGSNLDRYWHNESILEKRESRQCSPPKNSRYTSWQIYWPISILAR